MARDSAARRALALGARRECDGGADAGAACGRGDVDGDSSCDELRPPATLLDIMSAIEARRGVPSGITSAPPVGASSPASPRSPPAGGGAAGALPEAVAETELVTLTEAVWSARAQQFDAVLLASGAEKGILDVSLPTTELPVATLDAVGAERST
jgi:hypothetical protein